MKPPRRHRLLAALLCLAAAPVAAQSWHAALAHTQEKRDDGIRLRTTQFDLWHQDARRLVQASLRSRRHSIIGTENAAGVMLGWLRPERHLFAELMLAPGALALPRTRVELRLDAPEGRAGRRYEASLSHRHYADTRITELGWLRSVTLSRVEWQYGGVLAGDGHALAARLRLGLQSLPGDGGWAGLRLTAGRAIEDPADRASQLPAPRGGTERALGLEAYGWLPLDARSRLRLSAARSFESGAWQNAASLALVHDF